MAGPLPERTVPGPEAGEGRQAHGQVAILGVARLIARMGGGISGSAAALVRADDGM